VTSSIPDGVRAPGRKPSHYAPGARVVLASHEQASRHVEQWQAVGQRVGVLASERPMALPAGATWLALDGDIHEQGRQLYRRLRDADHLGLQVLVVVMPPDGGLGHALRDRLRRAAGLGDGGVSTNDTGGNA